MANVILSSTTEGVKYFLSPHLKEQEYIMNRGETIQTTIWVYANISPSQTIWFSASNLGLQTNWISSIILPFDGSGGVTSQIEEVLKKLHQDWVRIPKPAEVRDYLVRYPDLTSILPFVCKIARERVGIHPELSLEVYCDPEIEDEYLTLYVRQQHYDEDILDKIEDVRKQYEDMLIGRSGWLLVTTDFHPPKVINMSFDWKEYLNLARFLQGYSGSSFTQEAGLRCSVSRAYYAAYCHARNYARGHSGFAPTYKSADHGRLREHFQTLRMTEISSKLDDLRIWRNSCDYDDSVSSISVVVSSALARSQEIIGKLK